MNQIIPSSQLTKMMKQGNDILGTDYPIIGGAMAWISESTLVSEISNAGAMGVLACGAMSLQNLAQEIDRTKEKTYRNFGVNIILAHPDVRELVELCGEKKVSHVFFAGGIPTTDLIQQAHSFGMCCAAFAPTLPIAKKLFKSGIDMLIIEGHEAGGHVGPVSTLVLVQEILLNMKGYPIIVAGGICRGEVFSSLLLLGAYGCQLGSIFACCKESIAHSNFKKAFLSANSRDAVVSVQIEKTLPVTAVRALENKAYRDFMLKQKEAFYKLEAGEISTSDARLMLEHFWAGALKRAVFDGDMDTGSIMAGQSVGLIKEERSVRDIILTFLAEAESFIKNI